MPKAIKPSTNNKVHLQICAFHAAILRYKNTEDLLQYAVKDAIKHAGASVAWLGKWDSDSQQVQTVMLQGSGTENEEALSTLFQSFPPTNLALCTTFFDQNTAQTYANINEIQPDNFWQNLLRKNQWQSAVALPLLNNTGVFGLLVLVWDKTRVFNEHTRKSLEEISQDVSKIIQSTEKGYLELETTKAFDKYETLFSNAGWGMAIADPITHKLVYVNNSFAKMHGYSLTEAQQLNLSNTFSNGAKKKLEQLAGKVHQLGDLCYQNEHIRKDGSTFMCRTHVTSYKNAEGDVEFRAATFEDITEEIERKKTIDQLHKKNKKISKSLSKVFNRVSDCFVALDENWTYTYLNPQAVALFKSLGVKANLRGKCIWDEFPPEPSDPFHAAYHQALETQKPLVFEHFFKPANRWLEHRVYPSEDGLTIYFTDVSNRRQLQRSMYQSDIIYKTTRDGVMVTDLNGNILAANPAFTVITGYTEQEAMGKNARILKSGKHSAAFQANIWLGLREQGHWQGEIWNRRKNGDIYPEWVSINRFHFDDFSEDRYVAVFSDISKIKQSEAQLQHLAHHDSLTGLPNRAQLFIRLQHSMDIAKRNKTLLALLMFDLDHFKDVNDSFGHSAGDELLINVTQLLVERFRAQDCICRLGGDEFTVVLDDLASPDAAARIAEDIIHILSAPIQLANHTEVRISASVGISLYPDHSSNAEELLQQADTALYSAKDEGRSRYKFFNQALTASVRARLEIESELRHAIDKNQLCVHFQPQIDIKTRAIIGAEALVRWQHPEKGLIPPIYFIPVAEATGLISKIGNWVLINACQHAASWLQRGLKDFTLAINLSPHQFLHGDIEAVIRKATIDTGFPAQNLELEITEGTLMEREADAIKILTSLREIGVRVAIDDFGTGYSSLSYLKRFPLDTLKIDRSFIAGLPADQDDDAITSAIIAMAHSLRLKVLAEGVETQGQLDFLAQKNCDYYQGYFMSKPLAAEQFLRLLEQHHCFTE